MHEYLQCLCNFRLLKGYLTIYLLYRRFSTIREYFNGISLLYPLAAIPVRLLRARHEALVEW